MFLTISSLSFSLTHLLTSSLIHSLTQGSYLGRLFSKGFDMNPHHALPSANIIENPTTALHTPAVEGVNVHATSLPLIPPFRIPWKVSTHTGILYCNTTCNHTLCMNVLVLVLVLVLLRVHAWGRMLPRKDHEFECYEIVSYSFLSHNPLISHISKCCPLLPMTVCVCVCVCRCALRKTQPWSPHTPLTRSG